MNTPRISLAAWMTLADCHAQATYGITVDSLDTDALLAAYRAGQTPDRAATAAFWASRRAAR